MTHYAPPVLSQRAIVFAGIVGFHVVLVYFLATGLATQTIQVILQPLEGTILPEKIVEPTRPPPPPTTITDRAIVDFGPDPDFDINIPDGGTAITRPPVADPPTVIIEPPPRIDPIHLVGKHRLPNTEDFYPPHLIRLGVEGATNIRICVDESGRRQGDPTVIESSGDARLDEAALTVGRAGRYARSARGETYVPNCYAFRIVFKVSPK